MATIYTGKEYNDYLNSMKRYRTAPTGATGNASFSVPVAKSAPSTTAQDYMIAAKGLGANFSGASNVTGSGFPSANMPDSARSLLTAAKSLQNGSQAGGEKRLSGSVGGNAGLVNDSAPASSGADKQKKRDEVLWSWQNALRGYGTFEEAESYLKGLGVFTDYEISSMMNSWKKWNDAKASSSSTTTSKPNTTTTTTTPTSTVSTGEGSSVVSGDGNMSGNIISGATDPAGIRSVETAGDKKGALLAAWAAAINAGRIKTADEAQAWLSNYKDVLNDSEISSLINTFFGEKKTSDIVPGEKKSGEEEPGNSGKTRDDVISEWNTFLESGHFGSAADAETWLRGHKGLFTDEEIASYLAAWDEKNKKAEVPSVDDDAAGGNRSTLSGAYLSNATAESQRNFAQSVRLANDDYYRSLMTYGMNAEALAGAGLTGAGVSNFGNASAWAARQGAVSGAALTKQQADTEALRNHAEMSAAAEQERQAARQSVLNAILTQGVTDEEMAKEMMLQTGAFDSSEIEALAKKYSSYAAQQKQEANAAANQEAKAAAYNGVLAQKISDPAVIATQLRMTGLFTEEEIAQYSDQIAGYWTGQVKAAEDAATAEDAAAKLASATNDYNTLLANGSTPEAARSTIQSLYGDDIANSVVTNSNAATSAGIEDKLKLAETSSGYSPFAEGNELTKANLDGLLATSIISQEQYDGYLSRIQAMNEKWVMGILEDAHNTHNFKDACAALGITIENEDDAATYGGAAVEALREAVFNMVKSGDISSEKASAYLAKDFEYEYEATLEKFGDSRREVGEIAKTLSAFKEFSDRIGNTEIYEQILDKIVDDLEFSYKGDSYLTVTGKSGYTIGLAMGTTSDADPSAWNVDPSSLKEVPISSSNARARLYMDGEGNLYVNFNVNFGIDHESAEMHWAKVDLFGTNDKKLTKEEAAIIYDVFMRKFGAGSLGLSSAPYQGAPMLRDSVGNMINP